MNGRPIRALSAVARSLMIVLAGSLAVALGAPGVGAHDDGTTSHLWNGHIKPMREPGTINTDTNPVNWTKLKDVPAGFADGKDNGIDKAGFGLGIGRGPFFYVDTSKVQKRVNSFCATGQAIKSINTDGSVNCTKGPRGFTLTDANTGPMCDVSCTEGTLVLSPGTWAINAKIQISQNDPDEDRLWAGCELDAGGLVDRSNVAIEASLAQEQTIPMQLIATLSNNVHASVACGDHDVGQAMGHYLSIIAIRLSD